jgi:glycosyltransferase involved in cell wall biosynthesis
MEKMKLDGGTPRVSVIIPTYNRSAIMKRAIDSVLAQTFTDFEMIIVDDGSDDDVKSVVDVYCDERIRYIRHEKNCGLSRARNTGIENARGFYVAFLDDDDEWLPRKLELQLDHLSRRPRVDASFTGCIHWDEESGREVDTTIPSETAAEPADLLMKNTYLGASSSLVVKKYCFETAGCFDEALPSCEDWDMWIRLARQHRIESLDDILVKKYRSENSMMTNIGDRIAARNHILEKIADELENREDTLAYHHFRTGLLHCQIGEFKAGRQEAREAIRLSPLKGRQYLLYVITLLGAVMRKRTTQLVRRVG